MLLLGPGSSLAGARSSGTRHFRVPGECSERLARAERDPGHSAKPRNGSHAIALATSQAALPRGSQMERAAANSEPGQPRPTGRRLPPFGHRDQAFALRQFPGSFARAPDGFCLLAGFALGRFFVSLATLHLTKNALALHLLFEGSESLFDIVVANEYLQNVSNPGAACAKLIAPARPSCDRSSEISFAYG